MSRFRPKDFAPPRSRAARELAAKEIYGALSTTDILKELWPDAIGDGGPIFDRPEWAKTAKKFGWITEREYYAIEPEDTGRVSSWDGLMYTASPFFALLKKGSLTGVHR